MIPAGNAPTVKASPAFALVSIIVADSMFVSSTSVIVTSVSTMLVAATPAPVGMIVLVKSLPVAPELLFASRSRTAGSLMGVTVIVIASVSLNGTPALSVERTVNVSLPLKFKSPW